MNALNILNELEQASGKNEKIKILKRNYTNKELKDLLNAALNFKSKFHIKKFDENILPKNYRTTSHGSSMHQEFMSLLNVLEKRELTGNAAIAAVEEFMNGCGNDTAKWYARILRKDLKSGYGISTANKSGYGIPIFEVQLAKDGTKCKKLNQILANGAYASPKLDGYRCKAVIENGEATLYSRNGTVFENFPGIEEDLIAMFWNEEHNSKHVLDGEIMSSDFNSMQQTAFSSKSGKSVGDVVYNIFDIIPFSEWETGSFVKPAGERYESLGILFDMMKPHMIARGIDSLKEVPHTPVTTLKEILELEKQFIELGYEGVMVNPDIPYYRGKKSNRMLKFKTMKSMEATVTSCYEGRPGTKYEGTLGGFHIVQEGDENGLGAGVTCEVGARGDKDRDSIWADQKVCYNRTIEVKYQELTLEGRMRFPIFSRWRPDKDESD